MAANPDFADLDRVDYTKYRHIVPTRPDPNLPGLLLVTIDGTTPGTKFNALTPRMHREAGQIWIDIKRDPTVSVVVLTGKDPGFCAGGALGGAGDKPYKYPPGEGAMAGYDENRSIVRNMLDCDKIIISAINGVAVGGGLALAFMADITIAAENARFGDGHTKLGVAAGDHAAGLWPLCCSMAKAKYYIFTGEIIGAVEAERIGLVSKLVPEGKSLEEAMRVGRDLALGPQHALKHTKRALNTWLWQSGQPAFEFSAALESLDFMHDDSREGGRMFAQKRVWPKSAFPSAVAQGAPAPPKPSKSKL